MPDHQTESVKELNSWYILTMGLPKVSEPLVLAPGVSLRSIGEPITVFDLAAAGAVGFRGWSTLEPIAPACKCEIESVLDANVTPGYDILNRAWLASTLLVLRGFTHHLSVACSSYSWQKIAGYQRKHCDDLPLFTGKLLDFHLKILSDGKTQPTQVTQDDAQWVYSHFDTFNALATESESFRFALEAATGWRYNNDPRSAVAQLWAGIEAVFGVSSELVYRISLLSASLTRPKGAERKRRFDEVKKLYGMRSKIVHGDKLSKKKIYYAVAMSSELLRDLLLLAVERGHMLGKKDFDEAVFY